MRGVKVSVSVVVDPRENCIMCCNCHSNCPEVFETSEMDGKSQIREEHRVDGDIAKGEVDESLLDCARLAVDLCPVSIIFVEY
jgi:ferredoxin